MRKLLGSLLALCLMAGGAEAALYRIQHGTQGDVTIGKTIDQPVSFVFRYKCEWPESEIFSYNGVALCDGYATYSTYQTVDVTLDSTYEFLTYNGEDATTDLLGNPGFLALGNAQSGPFTWYGLSRFTCFMISAIYTCQSDYGWEYGVNTRFGYAEVGAFGYQTISQVPLPAAAWLFLAGIAGIAGARRKSLSRIHHIKT